MTIHLAGDARLGGLLSLPPSELVTSRQIREAIERYGAAKAARYEADQAVLAARQALPAAAAADDELLANKLERGKADDSPGTPNTLAAQQALAEAERHLRASAIVVERKREALVAALERDGDKWRADLERDLAKAGAEWHEALAGVVEAHGRLMTARSLTEFTRRGHWSAPATATAFVGRVPEAVDVSVALAALRALAPASVEDDEQTVAGVA